MTKGMKMLAVFVMIVVLGIFIAANMAMAGDRYHNIKGDYAFTGAATCLTSPAGFNADLTPKGGWYYESFSVQGVWTFNHDGTGIRKGRGVSITFYSPGHAGSFDFQAPFTYTIGQDNTVTTELSSQLTGQILTGSRAGQTFTIDQISLQGLIAKDNEGLTIASTEPQIETTVYSNGNIIPRICYRSRVLLRLHENEGHRK
jgi:hypothetical protein